MPDTCLHPWPAASGLKKKEKKRKEKKRKEKKRKDHTIWRQVNEKPSNISGCPRPQN